MLGVNVTTVRTTNNNRTIDITDTYEQYEEIVVLLSKILTDRRPNRPWILDVLENHYINLYFTESPIDGRPWNTAFIITPGDQDDFDRLHDLVTAFGKAFPERCSEQVARYLHCLH